MKKQLLIILALFTVLTSCKKEYNYYGSEEGTQKEVEIKPGEDTNVSIEYIKSHNDFKIVGRWCFDFQMPTEVIKWKLQSGTKFLVIREIPDTVFYQPEYNFIGAKVDSELILSLVGRGK